MNRLRFITKSLKKNYSLYHIYTLAYRLTHTALHVTAYEVLILVTVKPLN